MAVQDLWGEIPSTEGLRTPLLILREQAALLGQKTGNILEGDVHVSRAGDNFRASLRIVAPALDNYIYTVLHITYPMISYPVRVLDVEGPPIEQNCQNEEAFIEVLKRILSSDRVKKAITSLLAQSKANE